MVVKTILYSLADILHLTTFTSQYQKVLHSLVEKVVRLFNCQTYAVVLIDRKTEYLSIENYYGISYTYCEAYRRKLATGTRVRRFSPPIPLLGKSLPSIFSTPRFPSTAFPTMAPTVR